MNTKRSFNLINLFLGLIILCSTSVLGQINQALVQAKADTLIQQSIELGEHMGLSAAILANNEIIWSKGDGFINKKANIPATAKMIHRIASISKPMTALAIMQLFENGKVDLDVPIQNYIPDFPKKPEGDITIRQLLTHTSGINHYKNFLDGFSLKEYPNLTAAMGRFQDRELVGKPGTEYKYTTYGYVVLGVIIEKVSGLDYETYMRKNIWEPAGMHHTSVEKHKAVIENKSELYTINKKRKLKGDLNTNLSMKVPGGGIQSSAEDLLRFGKALINNTLIKKETLELMLTDPAIRPKEHGNPYAMGWFLYEDDKRGRIIGHSGAQAGTATQFMVLIDKGIAVSCLSNTRNQWPNIFGLSWKLIDLVTSEDALQQKLSLAHNLSKTELDRFVGAYDFGKGGVLYIKRKGNQLYSNINEFKNLRLYPQGKNKLVYRHSGAHFEFEMDQNNQVVKTTYLQNGQEFHPVKIK